MKALGQHLLIELYGCEPRVLDEVDVVRDTMLGAADLVGATVLGVTEHRFEPHGVSVVVVIAESHVSIHTWPEYRYAAVDVFTCGEALSSDRVVDFVSQRLCAQHATMVEVKRGILPSACSSFGENRCLSVRRSSRA